MIHVTSIKQPDTLHGAAVVHHCPSCHLTEVFFTPFVARPAGHGSVWVVVDFCALCFCGGGCDRTAEIRYSAATPPLEIGPAHPGGEPFEASRA